MDMSGMDHGGMSMGGSSSGPACKISMLWNWDTVDTCFLSSTWHVRSKGMFAGSIIGVFLLVIAIEALRRTGREYDRHITKRALAGKAMSGTTTPTMAAGSKVGDAESTFASLNPHCAPTHFIPSFTQQALRSAVYGSQFTASFLVMLLGMYFNGYILFAIFLGQTVGFFAFGRDTCLGIIPEGTGSGHCC